MNISFVSVNHNTGNKENAYFLPHSAACIWSYLKSLPNNPYNLNHLLFRREPVDSIVEKLQHDDVVAFSCYMWNRKYCLTVAERLKEINPEIKIVFGGPELEVTDISFFSKYPYIDVHVINEGERVFSELVFNFDNLSSVDGIIYNENGRTITTKPAQRITDLSILPSPYLDGTFDDLADEYPEIEWNCVIETNRGCPYKCSFCDWGSLTYSKVKKFELERIFKEFEWVFTHNCYSVELADANFGIFVDRDNLIVDEFIRLIHKHNKQVLWHTNWAKNQNSTVVNIVKKLITEGDQTNSNLTVALQSLDDTVLEEVHRKNLHTNKIKELYEECQKHNVPICTEFIMGLPKDTLNTYKQNYYKIFEISCNIHINIYTLLGLSNSELTLSNQDNVQWRAINGWVENSTDDVDEDIKWVYSTDSMSHHDIYKAAEFSCFINAFHLRGFTNFIAEHYHNNNLMSYEDFYEGLYSFCMDDPYIKEYFKYFKEQHSSWYITGKSNWHKIEGLPFHANNYLYHFVTKVHADNKTDYLFDIIEAYLKEVDCFHSDIFELQKALLITYENESSFPKVHNGQTLINPNNTVESKREFLRKIYFWRERSFGKAMINSLEDKQAA